MDDSLAKTSQILIRSVIEVRAAEIGIIIRAEVEVEEEEEIEKAFQ